MVNRLYDLEQQMLQRRRTYVDPALERAARQFVLDADDSDEELRRLEDENAQLRIKLDALTSIFLPYMQAQDKEAALTAILDADSGVSALIARTDSEIAAQGKQIELYKDVNGVLKVKLEELTQERDYALGMLTEMHDLLGHAEDTINYYDERYMSSYWMRRDKWNQENR